MESRPGRIPSCAETLTESIFRQPTSKLSTTIMSASLPPTALSMGQSSGEDTLPSLDTQVDQTLDFSTLEDCFRKILEEIPKAPGNDNDSYVS